MDSKEIWIRADGPDGKEERKELVLSALESGIEKAIVRPEDSDFSEFGKVELLFNDGGRLSGGYELVELATPEDQERAMAMAGKVSGVVLDSRDWAVIPLENMIARFRDTDTKVLACADDVETAKLYMQTLEKGVDGVVVCTPDPNAIRRFSDILQDTGRVELSEVEVTDVRNIEIGDRVCVDTVTNMVPGEGMLIGSQAACLFLVQSESEDNGYVAARPFRVNAGAVHAYAMGPEGRTKYLSEYRSGDSIVLVKRDGSTRASAVGSPMSMVPENPSGRMPRSIGLLYVTSSSLPGASGTEPRRSRRISTISVSHTSRSAAELREAQTFIISP